MQTIQIKKTLIILILLIPLTHILNIFTLKHPQSVAASVLNLQ
jgi:hypothetical protein